MNYLKLSGNRVGFANQEAVDWFVAQWNDKNPAVRLAFRHKFSSLGVPVPKTFPAVLDTNWRESGWSYDLWPDLVFTYPTELKLQLEAELRKTNAIIEALK